MKHRDHLREHADSCEQCREQPLPLERIATRLDRELPATLFSGIAERTLTRLRPELQRLAQRALWRRTAASILVALLPLPVVLAVDALLLQYFYEWLSVVLPHALVLYVLATYVACMVFLFASTYAAIPVVLSRGAVDRMRPMVVRS